MNKQLKNPRQMLLLIGGIAAILVSGIAIAALAMSGRNLTGTTASASPAEQPEAPETPAPGGWARKCLECGVIESTRETGVSAEKPEVKAASRGITGSRGSLQETQPGSREISVRMQNGSLLVITDPNPGQWKQGERVKILAGVN